MQKRLNKEKKIDYPRFHAKIGTINKEQPNTIYLTGRGYFTPQNELDKYNLGIVGVENGIREHINKIVSQNSILSNNYILNLEIADKRIQYGKKSYMFFQVFFHQTNKQPLGFGNIVPMVNNDMKEILSGVEKAFQDKHFNLL